MVGVVIALFAKKNLMKLLNVRKKKMWLLQKIRLFFIVWFEILDLARIFILIYCLELSLEKAHRRYKNTLEHDEV